MIQDSVMPDNDFEADRILFEHTRLLDSDPDYMGAGVLHVDSLQDHERHITEHNRFLVERGVDLRIQDRSGLEGHVKVHRIVLKETDLITRRRIAREISDELFGV